MRTISRTLVLAITVGTAASSLPQTAQKAAFEVASIKPHLPSDPRPTAIITHGDRVIARGYTLRGLVLLAYSPGKEKMLDQFLAGGPGWTAIDRFDIEAKASEDLITLEQLHLMLQTLLAERFQLSLHRELREMPVYDLIVTKRER